MIKRIFIVCLILTNVPVFGQTLTETQMRNARASGYAIVASKNPGTNFSIYMIPWDGINTLEYNANNQINPGWHAQAAIKGNYFYQEFDGSDFSVYSSIITSQQQFDNYKSTGTQWWIVCSTLPPYSENYTFRSLHVSENTTLSGNVAIGTIPSENYQLNVDGIIRANEVIVNTSGADFVFSPEHKLPSLAELESFIKENNRLPNMASAAEMEEKGLNVSEMQTKLLQKIEELTLYTIEQNKKLEQQNLSIKSLEEKLKNK